MQLFQLLAALDRDLAPEHCKIHLACWNGYADPLDVYLAGSFDSWQEEQNQKNFERPLVLSLIQFRGSDRWLFAGTHDSNGCKPDPARPGCFRYDLCRRPRTDELDGRLIVSFKRRGRASYLLADHWVGDLTVAEILPEKLRVAEFPGYSKVTLSKQHLDIIVRQQIPSWKAALSAVAGVYVIADRSNGKLYVGSANAGEGIWGRWCAYSATGHGGNVELKLLLAAAGAEYADNFQFSILEIADTHASRDDVLVRESHWKDVLLSRTPHGYNAN